MPSARAQRLRRELPNKIGPGQWVTPEDTFFLGCCDCGLVHRFQFIIKNGDVQFRVFHATRITCNNRNSSKFKYARKRGRR